MSDKRFIEGIIVGIKMVHKFIDVATTDLELDASINAAIQANQIILDDTKSVVTSRNPASVCGLE
jgi:hypothetical protein